MKTGKILAYSAAVSAGLILCTNGIRYQFDKSQFLSLPAMLLNDQDVTFDSETGHSGQTGRAFKINAMAIAA